MSTAGSQTLASLAGAAESEKSTSKNTEREMGRCKRQGVVVGEDWGKGAREN